MKLVAYWKQVWRLTSAQLAGLLALAATAYEYLPALQPYLPPGAVKWVALAIIAARVIQQNLEKKSTEARRADP